MRVTALILAGGAGTRLGVLSEQPRQAGRAVRRAIPHHRFHPLQLRQFRDFRCRGADAVFAALAQRPHRHRPAVGSRPQPRRGAAAPAVSGRRATRTGTAARPMRCCKTSTILRDSRADTVVILSGDHIYKMDYRPMIRAHETRRADLTVAVMNVPPDEANRFGIVLTDESDRVIRFLEKPKDPPSTLANMGVYVFNVAALTERIRSWRRSTPTSTSASTSSQHGGAAHRIYTYPFDGYWVDVGTVDAYWNTSMELVSGAVQAEPLRSELGHPHQERRTPAGEARAAGRRATEHDLQRLHRARPGDPVGAVAGGVRLAGRRGARQRHHERYLDRAGRGGGSLHRGQERGGGRRHKARLG